MRPDRRARDELRAVKLELGYSRWAEGSCLIHAGGTIVLVTATVEDKVPPFVRGSGQGWIQAEYAMLPRATQERTHRESVRGRQQGRSIEIQRLIGRSLRAALYLNRLGERSIILDCDVLQADGGTRTAAITAAFMALWQAVHAMHKKTPFEKPPFRGRLAAVSVGLKNGESFLDLSYQEDVEIDVDFNLARMSTGQWVELQGTGEHSAFSREQLDQILDLGAAGLDRLDVIQRDAFREGAGLIET
ncbi:MAG: ribonuclease PH [Sulfobacillus acidophilus]|uniref:Ribonuclease PH n=1 Tax=Sulfobacillus acidophilus TaxID=53633 RepID=A0A2T2WJ74_9FIRM|nr:MAG: ribonuclease PH [Sulfobacillus acidophilus]